MTNEDHEPKDPHGAGGSGSNNEIRIGHDERQRASDDLAEHFAAGRLEQSEFEERTDAVWKAKTVAELQPLFFDLPGGSLNGYLTSQATSGAERSSRAPAQRGYTSPSSVQDVEKGHTSGRRKLLRVLMAIFPLLMVIAFSLLSAAGVEIAWVVFFLVPIFYITARALMPEEDDEDD